MLTLSRRSLASRALARPVLAAVLACAVPVAAQVPRVAIGALDHADDAPTGDATGGFDSGSVLVTNSQMEDALAGLLAEYRETGRARTLRQSTMMVFPFGHSQPVLATVPLRASVIELEPGEVVYGIAAGDTERFAYETTYTGRSGDTPVVLVKPLDFDVTTNLVISTDRRIYHVTLDSPPATSSARQRSSRSGADRSGTENPQERYARHIRFYYPDEALARLADGLGVATALSGQTETLASLSDLHFGYHVAGDHDVTGSIARVFDDGVHTYIEMTAEAQLSGAAPVLFVLGPGGQRETLNYTLRDGRYITDRTFSRAELVLGATVRKGLFGLGGTRQVERRAVIVREPAL